MLLLSSSVALADDEEGASAPVEAPLEEPAGQPAGEPVGDPPPAPAPLEPVPADPLDEAATPAAPAVEEERQPLPPPEEARPSRARRRGPTPLEVAGLSAGAGAAAAVAGAAGAVVVGGATLATALAFEQTLVTPDFRAVAVLAVLGGAIATPFAAALAASMATLFVTRPTAGPEEYAELGRTCLSCAMAAACAGLCLAGGFVGGPSVFLSPSSCAGPAPPVGPREGTDNPVALAAGAGVALGTVAGAAAMWFALTSSPAMEPLVTGGALVGGAAAGAAVGGLVVGGAAVLVERWRYVVFE